MLFFPDSQHSEGSKSWSDFLCIWLGSAAAAVKKSVPFQEKLAGSPIGEASNDLTGEYYLSEEEFPSGFTDFARFELETDSSGVDTGMPAPTTGAVYADRTYKMRTVAIDGENLVFETEGKGGISYRFNGKVLQADESNLRERGVGDIIGKLEKVKNGMVIASVDTAFYLFGS